VGETFGVVGAGIVGLAVARELARRRPGSSIVVWEKEAHVGAHQTGHNSGVVHAGIYYRPGSLKAELCTRGRLLLADYCAEHKLPFDACGKLVVAVDTDEIERLDALERTARQNGVPGLRRVSAGEIRELEPHAAGLVALHSPGTAITDYTAVAETMASELRADGGDVRMSAAVTGIRQSAGGILVESGGEARHVDRLVVCAGLQADRVSRWVDGEADPRIVPFRGEYLSVRPEKRSFVRGMVYPVPDPRYPFLGVHFTRRVSGELEVGPNAVLALRREGYGRYDVAPSDVRELVAFPGFWRMARRHWRTGVKEVGGSLSTRAFMRAAQRYVPEIGPADVVRGGAGVRAQAVERDGSLLDDFRITESDGVTCIRNAPSPAATSSLAIAEHVAARVLAP
jgi:(S)-2-hydroxyglutarate dehydrogenase